MIRELMHDPIFLAGKSGMATKEDLQVANDLLETLIVHMDLRTPARRTERCGRVSCECEL